MTINNRLILASHKRCGILMIVGEKGRIQSPFPFKDSVRLFIALAAGIILVVLAEVSGSRNPARPYMITIKSVLVASFIVLPLSGLPGTLSAFTSFNGAPVIYTNVLEDKSIDLK